MCAHQFSYSSRASIDFCSAQFDVANKKTDQWKHVNFKETLKYHNKRLTLTLGVFHKAIYYKIEMETDFVLPWHDMTWREEQMEMQCFWSKERSVS